jgi:hypothetical protein
MQTVLGSLTNDTVKTVTLIDKDLQEAYKLTLSDIDNANHILGLGWQYKDTAAGLRIKANCSDCKSHKFLQFHPLQGGGFYTIAGWLITALAICMGAPFWFDMLNKVIRLRNAGTKPSDNNTKK